jgi:hypothetical protein
MACNNTHAYDISNNVNDTRVPYMKPNGLNNSNNYGLSTAQREPGSSGSIVSDYGLDDLAIEVRFPAEAKGFFL